MVLSVATYTPDKTHLGSCRFTFGQAGSSELCQLEKCKAKIHQPSYHHSTSQLPDLVTRYTGCASDSHTTGVQNQFPLKIPQRVATQVNYQLSLHITSHHSHYTALDQNRGLASINKCCNHILILNAHRHLHRQAELISSTRSD